MARSGTGSGAGEGAQAGSVGGGPTEGKPAGTLVSASIFADPSAIRLFSDALEPLAGALIVADPFGVESVMPLMPCGPRAIAMAPGASEPDGRRVSRWTGKAPLRQRPNALRGRGKARALRATCRWMEPSTIVGAVFLSNARGRYA
jgi:hypothetical protein